VTRQAIDDPRVSPDATVDTLRIDVIDAKLNTSEFRTAVAPDVSDWPITFGVKNEEGHPTIRLRALLFRSIWSSTGELGDGASVVEPYPELAVTRALEISVPDDGVKVVKAVLHGDCMGVAPSFGTPFHTCVAKGLEFELATSGLDFIDEIPSSSEVG